MANAQQAAATGTGYDATVKVTTLVRPAMARGTAFNAGQAERPRVTASIAAESSSTDLFQLEGHAVVIEWQDPLNDAGQGSVTVPVSEALAAELVHGRMVRCRIDGVPRYAFHIEKVGGPLVATGEESTTEVTASGRGLLATVFERSLIYPPHGPATVPLADHRIFSFADPQWASYIASSQFWPNATELWQQGDVGSLWTMADASAAPANWPDPTAFWIGGGPGTPEDAPEGKTYFRTTLTLGFDTHVQIYATGDNLWTLYVNGVPTLGDDQNTLAWQETRTTTLRLPAGDHTIAAVVENTAGVPGANPTALLVAIAEVDATGANIGWLLESDSTWKVLSNPATEPGWTAGAIIIAMMDEVLTRGGGGDLDWNFTEQYDTALTPWPTIPAIAVPIGASLWDLIALLVGQGHCDVWMDPAGRWLLNAWRYGTRGQTRAVSLEQGDNLTGLEVEW